MDDALLVRRFQRLGDLSRNQQRFVHWNRPLGDAVRERRALDELHHERGRTVRSLQSVDLRDVRMIELRQDFRFALEAREALGVARHRGRQHLDCDVALQVRIGRAVHFPIPPTPIWAVISYGPRRDPGASATDISR